MRHRSLLICIAVGLRLNIRIYLILEWCCVVPLAVVPGRAAPLGVEIDAVVVRVPSHVVPVHMGHHRQWRCHLHARSLVSEFTRFLPSDSPLLAV